jgi:hypothetical protein
MAGAMTAARALKRVRKTLQKTQRGLAAYKRRHTRLFPAGHQGQPQFISGTLEETIEVVANSLRSLTSSRQRIQRRCEREAHILERLIKYEKAVREETRHLFFYSIDTLIEWELDEERQKLGLTSWLQMKEENNHITEHYSMTDNIVTDMHVALLDIELLFLCSSLPTPTSD